MPSNLQKRIGYSFRDVSLLEAALTHASLQKDTGDNERLEFLGDRVLGLVLADLLYRVHMDENEGDLARRHAALVRQEALATVAQNLNLAADLRAAAGTAVQPAAVMADAAEALIGAIYLDGGFAAAEKFITLQWQDLLAKQPLPPEDPKTALQEWAQKNGRPLPVYTILSRSGADHTPIFTVEVKVEGLGSAEAVAANKRAAEKDAAALLLAKARRES